MRNHTNHGDICLAADNCEYEPFREQVPDNMGSCSMKTDNIKYIFDQLSLLASDHPDVIDIYEAKLPVRL